MLDLQHPVLEDATRESVEESMKKELSPRLLPHAPIVSSPFTLDGGNIFSLHHQPTQPPQQQAQAAAFTPGPPELGEWGSEELSFLMQGDGAWGMGLAAMAGFADVGGTDGGVGTPGGGGYGDWGPAS